MAFYSGRRYRYSSIHLITEDDMLYFSAYSSILSQLGRNVTRSNNIIVRQDSSVALPRFTGLLVLPAMTFFDYFEDEPLPPISIIAYGKEVFLPSCLAAGCRDYICAPLKIPELVARLKRALDWETLFLTSARIGISPNHIYSSTCSYRISTAEYRLLSIIARNYGSVVSRDAIYQEIWGIEPADSRAVDVYISRIRKLFKRVCVKSKFIPVIQSVYKKGYKLLLAPVKYPRNYKKQLENNKE